MASSSDKAYRDAEITALRDLLLQSETREKILAAEVLALMAKLQKPTPSLVEVAMHAMPGAYTCGGVKAAFEFAEDFLIEAAKRDAALSARSGEGE